MFKFTRIIILFFQNWECSIPLSSGCLSQHKRHGSQQVLKRKLVRLQYVSINKYLQDFENYDQIFYQCQLFLFLLTSIFISFDFYLNFQLSYFWRLKDFSWMLMEDKNPLDFGKWILGLRLNFNLVILIWN